MPFRRVLPAYARPFPPSEVESRNTDAEVDPREVGLTREGVDEIWASATRLYTSRLHPALALCVRRDGKVVLDRALGHVRGNAPYDPPGTPLVPVKHDSLFNLFSGSKAIIAMLIHLLDQRGLVHLDDHVVEYIPEFGSHGKDRITLRQLLVHRAGLPSIGGAHVDIDVLSDWNRIIGLLCDAVPDSVPGRKLAYHAMTGGYILGEVLRRVTGLDPRAFLRKEILDPLGFDAFDYGVAPARLPEIAQNALTGLPPLPPMTWLLQRSLGVTIREAVQASNDPRFLTAIVPSGNIVGTANEGSRFFELLRREGTLDGVTIFEPRTVRRAVAETSYLEIDATLGLPVRYGMGFMLGADRISLYGQRTGRAFGHLGFTAVFAWADPERRISACLMTSGKPFVTPGQLHSFNVTHTIARVCAPRLARNLLDGSPSQPASHYTALLSAREVDRLELARLSNLVSLGRVATFIGGASCLGAALWAKAAYAGLAGAALLAAFFVLVVVHARIAQKEDRVRAAILFAQRGLARVSDELDALPPRGERLKESGAPYGQDLDLFGKRSLLAVLDTMETDLSEARLGAWLSAPATPGEVRARQAAVAELAGDPSLLEALFVHGRGGAEQHPDLAVLLAWAKDTDELGPPLPLLRVLSFVLPAVTLTLLFVPSLLGVPGWAWLVPGLVQGLLALWIATRGRRALAAALAGAKALGRHASVLERLQGTRFGSAWLRALSERLMPAKAGLERLDGIASWAEARESGMFALLVGPMVLFDLHLVLSLMRFRHAHGKDIDGWLDALSDLLAIAGLATFRFDNPDFAMPAVEAGPPRYEAEALGHPLLAKRARVANDVRLEGPGTALLVTGSNMSGKSTLLRAMGQSIVLAQMGAPVCAKRLAVAPVLLRTSIRVSDSLASGVSHFYAELLALRRVVEDGQKQPVFFLLDEILHGTNSRERQVGAKSVIKHLLSQGAMGAVSTHDLGLAELVDELPGRVRPVHLVEQAKDGEMTFDYRLRDGLLTSGNALALMRQLGLPVDETELSEQRAAPRSAARRGTRRASSPADRSGSRTRRRLRAIPGSRTPPRGARAARIARSDTTRRPGAAPPADRRRGSRAETRTPRRSSRTRPASRCPPCRPTASRTPARTPHAPRRQPAPHRPRWPPATRSERVRIRTARARRSSRRPPARVPPRGARSPSSESTGAAGEPPRAASRA